MRFVEIRVVKYGVPISHRNPERVRWLIGRNGLLAHSAISVFYENHKTTFENQNSPIYLIYIHRQAAPLHEVRL
jgi:hypothetical protein